ncbi:hypothetical protein BDZ90DRAFT_231910 [Jaminaea rosea]|uniref:Protein kinase domain-containing protein n=1 Tax=Jaminaea rosea TaxID=1569628 RepID=A0A316US94_9BASI|nr:hypothetical protein BDZ90DRAFT_231910 [Jaminaea rosea]PWN28152.1 hypothetical protein BDZ90DRAFT_231910 [Jaminaea rosea]
MPLEQIRPLLALETRTSSQRQQQDDQHHHHHHQKASYLRRESQEDEGALRPSSPRTPIDGQGIPSPVGSSTLIGPASPSVRSTKSLYNSPYQFPRNDIESAESGSSSHSKKVGDDGVTRSGSWRSGGISVIGRGRSFDYDNEGAGRAASSPFGFSSLADDSEESAEGSSGSGSGSSASNLAEVHRRQGSLSRASTIGSHSSYSAAATSLRSLSNRSSTGSHSIPSSSPPMGVGSSRKLEDDQRRGSSEHGFEPGTTPSSMRGSDYAELLRRSSGFSSPGLGRVKSIGRGYDGSDQHQGQGDRLKKRASKISNLASDVPIEDEPPASKSALGIVSSVPSSSSPSPDSTVTQIELAPQKTQRRTPSPSISSAPSLQTSQTLSPPKAMPPTPSSPRAMSPRMRPTFAAGSSPSHSRHNSPRLGPLSPRMSPNLRDLLQGSGNHNQDPPPHRLGSPLGGSRWDAQFGYFPATSSTAGMSASNTTAESSVPTARRHTAGFLRSRSALAQQTSTVGAAAGRSTTTASTSFYGAGQEGGRKAARARARHPSLALLDNAPFSVLEARRSEGMRAAAASVGGPRTSSTSSSTGISSRATSREEVPERPLSPIAQASPDAPWSMLSLGSAITSADTARTSIVALPSAAMADGADPALVAAATSAAAAADEVRLTASPSQPSSAGPSPRMSRQHSRPFINPIAVPALTPTSPRGESRAASGGGGGVFEPSSPSGSSSSSSRPQMLRATTMSSSTTLSPPRSAAVPAAGISGPGGSGGGVSGMHLGGIVTHVLRTPTTEEWARFLASQGVEPGQQLPRSRTATGRSLAGFAAQHRASTTAAAAAAAAQATASTGGSTGERRPSLTLDALGQSGVNSSMTSVLGAMEGLVDVDSDSDEDDDGASTRGARRPRSDSGNSSDSSEEGRMEALRAAISMPPSRRGTPPGSNYGDDDDDDGGGGARSPGALNTSFQRALARQEAAANAAASAQQHLSSPTSAGAPFTSAVPSSGDPVLLQQVQSMYGYLAAPNGRKRSIDDFVIVRDVGRGAYGLVKLIRLRDPADGQAPVGPEFVVKYIIKSRILADCWRRHRILGPIPVEIHVMDQLRRLPFTAPLEGPEPWSPEYLWTAGTPTGDDKEEDALVTPPTPIPPRSTSLSPHIEEAGGAPPQRRRSISPNRAAAASHHAPSPSLLSAHPPLPAGYTPRVSTHPGLCTMLDFFEDESFYYLVMPRFGHGTDLFDYIESHPFGLATSEARCILGQVADGVRFLHQHNIVHRDIKDENVILDGAGHAQLIDFGSAAHVKAGRSFDTFSGTLDYAAAEILRGDKYGGKEQDVWALGVVSYVCLVGDAPFWNGEEAMHGLEAGSRARQALLERCSAELSPTEAQPAEEHDLQGDASEVVDSEGEPKHHHDRPSSPRSPSQEEISQRRDDYAGQVDGGGRLEDAMDLIERCLELQPHDRPTAADVCRHVFLAGEGRRAWRGYRGWEKVPVDGHRQEEAAV